MQFSRNSAIGNWVYGLIYGYNENKYWKWRSIAVDESKRLSLKKVLCFLKVKRCEAKNCAYMGTSFGQGAVFKSVPNLPHGLCGIFVSARSVIGRNCTIYQNVTIGSANGHRGGGYSPIIGDNCLIGAGAIIIGGIKVGNNVRIGAGAVVACDVPDNSTVISDKPIIIHREKDI